MATITKLALNGIEYELGNVIERPIVDATVNWDTPIRSDFRDFAEIPYTWEELHLKCQNGDINDLWIGDYKTIQLTDGEIVKMQIAGIDTYSKTLSSNGTVIEHHIDWISMDCLEDPVQWNTTNTNNGTSSQAFPYLASNVKNYLNNTVFPKIPSDVSRFIIDKRSLLERRYNSNRNATESDGTGWYNMGKLWLPCEYEVFGSVIKGTKKYSQSQLTQYLLFANNIRCKIKNKGNSDEIYAWWLATVRSGNSTHCCLVNYGGNIDGTYASNDAIGVPVCFRTT